MTARVRPSSLLLVITLRAQNPATLLAILPSRRRTE